MERAELLLCAGNDAALTGGGATQHGNQHGTAPPLTTERCSDALDG
jgi:hypothetical protein